MKRKNLLVFLTAAACLVVNNKTTCKTPVKKLSTSLLLSTTKASLTCLLVTVPLYRFP